TLTSSAARTANISQIVPGLTPGAQYTFTVIQAPPLDVIRLGVGTGSGNYFDIAQTQGALSALTLTFTATQASHAIVIESVTPDAPCTIARVSITDIVAAAADAHSVAT